MRWQILNTLVQAPSPEGQVLAIVQYESGIYGITLNGAPAGCGRLWREIDECVTCFEDMRQQPCLRTWCPRRPRGA